MIEARIYCRADIKVPDLDLDLKKGQVVWISDESFLRSKHIKHAQGIGAVEVQRKQRMRESRPPPPPFVSRVWKRPAQTPKAQVQPREKPQVDVSALLKEIQGLREDLKEQTRILASAIQNIKVVGGTVATSARGSDSGEISGSEPIYIPTNIVRDTEVELSVKSSESSVDVDEATNLLRQMRKK